MSSLFSLLSSPSREKSNGKIPTAEEFTNGSTLATGSADLEKHGGNVKGMQDTGAGNSAPGISQVTDERMTAGETYSSQEVPASEPQADMFRLRVGPNYRRTGNKEPSGPSLYDMAAVDVLKTKEGKLEKTFDWFKPVLGDHGVEGTNVPYSFVVTANIPQDEPSLFSTPGTGPSFVIVFHFVASPALVAQLKDLSSASPAVKLLETWCRDADGKRDCMGRFKAMCLIDNIEKQGFPGFISKFNGKPILINKSGSVVKYFEGEGGTLVEGNGGDGKRCKAINMLINVHVFAYIARKGLFSLLPSFKKMCLNLAFTIEGRNDEELPEVVLGCAKLDGMDLEKFLEKDGL